MMVTRVSLGADCCSQVHTPVVVVAVVVVDVVHVHSVSVVVPVPVVVVSRPVVISPVCIPGKTPKQSAVQS